MPAAIATVAVGAYSANRQNSAARNAANAQQQATDATIAEQRRQYDLTRQDYAPFREAGVDALGRQQAFLNGDRSGFENDAGYLFMRDEMQRGVERGAAARGGLFSGGSQADLAARLGGLANTTAGDYWNRLAGRAGQGQVATSGLASLGANMAGNIGNALQNGANARASSYYNQANNNSQLAAGLGGMFNNWYQNNSANNGGGSGWYLGSRPGAG